MLLAEHQNELRQTYVRGGLGAIVSSIVWLTAGLTAQFSNIANGFTLLFFGGMFIFPISKLALKIFYARAPESKSNPGGLIVIETIFPMIGCLFAAWLIMPYRPEFVFPLAAIAVGAHYFGFRTAYGDWTYWVLGSLLCLIGTFSIILKFPSSDFVAFTVAIIEVTFGIWLILMDRRELQER